MAFVEVAANTLDDAYSIDNSLRFNDGDSPYLNITSADGNEDIFTFSAWIKRSALKSSGEQFLMAGSSDGSNNTEIKIQNDQFTYINFDGSSNNSYIRTNAKLRDTSAWYHLVCSVDMSQSTNTNRIKLYINGTHHTSLDQTTYANQNTDTYMNVNNGTHRIGADARTAANYFDGYMAEVHYIDGTAKAASDFGKTNDNGVWVPIKYSGSYGTNGFFLEFKNGRINELETATLDVTISGSASLGTDTPANLVDEDFSTVGIGVDNGGGVVQFDADFGSGVTKTIKSYGFRAAKSGAISQVVIKGSNDDSTYTTIDTDTSLATTSSGTRWNFQNVTNTTAYRYYRWEITTTTADHPDIVQFEAYTTQPTIFNEQDKAGGLGKDTSGNGKHFSSHNIYGYSDQTTDTPTNNFAVYDAALGLGGTLAEGNCQYQTGSSYANSNTAFSSIGINKGKWYAEFKVTATSSGNSVIGAGYDPEIQQDGRSNFCQEIDEGWGYAENGNAYNNGATDLGTTYTTNDIVGVELDLDGNKIYWYKNGTLINSGGTAIDADELYFFGVSDTTAGGQTTVQANFGNPPYAISSGNADNNGYGNFEYAPTSGYLALCTKNLAEEG